MSYRLVPSREDYRDLASGSVLRSAPGYPAYPVRLAQELFLRALSHLPEGPVGLWDPCCGGGYLVTVVGLLRRERLRYVLATDVAPAAVALAGRNLALLTSAGLDARARELRRREVEHGKPGYGEAADAADRLAGQLRAAGGDITTVAGLADVFNPTALAALLPAPAPDLVLTDVPYDRQTSWQGSVPSDGEPLRAMIRALCGVLDDHAVIAVTAEARKVALGPDVRALQRFRVGTRAAFIGRVGQLRTAA